MSGRNLESLAGGGSIAVDVASIERELAALWKSAEEPGSAAAITRACQLNLVACCEGRTQARAADAILAAIVSACPSRAIVVVVEPDDGAGRLDAAISAHCAWTPGADRGRQVCCEQITLTGSGRAVDRLPGAVLPLLLPDLPVAVWCLGEPRLEGDGAFEKVVRAATESADRLVIDARPSSRPWETMRALAAFDQQVADLSWQRLRGWREMVASFFDGDGLDGIPARLTRLTATWASPRDGGAAAPGMKGAAEAILLSSWAASRLRWIPPARGSSKPDRATLRRPSGGPGGEIVLQCEPCDRPSGQVLSLLLEGDGVSLRVERSEVLDCVTATAQLPGAVPIPRSARVPEREEATLLCRALEPSGADPVHREAIRLAARLAGGAGPGGSA